ncbi:MAG: T9SS type B sorting domain-containing protein [Bacteroidia bacterium]
MQNYLRYIALFILAFYAKEISAQTIPANDDYKNAEKIIIGDDGYALGTFQSSKTDLTKASKEAGESIHLLQYFAGTDKKTVWFEFETQTARDVTIELRQRDTLISQDAVGITIYQSNSKVQPPNLGEVNKDLVPISKFGSTGNTCLTPGKYYVQVSAKQKANAEIWLNIVVNHASPAYYDQAKNAFQYGKLKNSHHLNFDIGCLGIDDRSEFMPALGPDYNQTAWFTFQTDNYSDIVAFAFSIYASSKNMEDSVLMGYRLYKGDARNAFGNLKRIDSAVFKTFCDPNNWGNCGQLGERKYVCGIQPDTVYSIQLLFHKRAKYTFQLQAEERGEYLSLAADPKKLPAAFKAGMLSQTPFKMKDHLACNSALSENLCGKVNPPLVIDSPVFSPDYVRIDTFDMSVWMTFDVPANGYIHIQNLATICGSTHHPFAFYLYKGDVSISCNLPLYWKSKYNGYYTSACIAPGKYSLQILGRKFKNRQGSLCHNMDLGKEIDMEIRFQKDVPQTPSKFHDPSKPEDLGDITAGLGTGVQSQIDYYGMPDDTVTIAGEKFFNRFHFRQFYLNKPTFLSIETIYYNSDKILFSGKVSDGVNTLKKIDGNIYGNPYIGNYPFRSTCTPLPAGWYTVVSYLQVYCGYQFDEYDFLTFRRMEMCERKFNRPHKASYFGDVDWNTSATTPGETLNRFGLAEECFNCTPDTALASKLLVPCNTNFTQVAYYVFNLKQESYVQVGANYKNSSGNYNDGFQQLYKGDIRKDSLKFKDTTLLLAPCSNGNRFCRLQPGIYTLVVMGNIAGKVVPVVIVDKIANASYDHARNAADLGVIPPTNKEKVSLLDIFYCTTGAQYTDPDTNSNYFYYHLDQQKTSVPYPMTKNYELRFDHIRRKNLWYTFSCAGTGNVTVTVYPKSNGTNRYSFSIYSSDEKYFGPYKNLVAAGKADSTNKQGLKFVTANYSSENTLTFTKNGCDSVRYYIIVERPGEYYSNSGNHALQVGVKYNSLVVNGVVADYCKNAAKVTLDKAGEKSVTAIVNCHTRGESFGEDGSNMACLLSDTFPYKTTWFKFTYTGTQRVDLSFRIQENTNMQLSQFRYRVLYGTCDAMTPGPCVENAYSYFTLDCMGPGDYFIQVVMPDDATGDVTLYAKAEPTTYPVCKPIDLLSPSANFSFTGGCNNTPVQFINLSSAGANIAYLWDFANGMTSTEKNPAVQFKPKQLKDTFLVKLRVTNIQSKKYDELIIPVVVFRDEIKLFLEEKEITIGCNDKVQLKASSNYPFGRYEWKPKQGLDNPHSATPNVTYYYSDATYTVTLFAESCILTDTVHIYIRPEMLITGDTMLCTGTKGTLTALSGYTYYYWSDNQNTQTIEIDKPGKYWVTGYVRSGCRATDTFIVKDGSEGIVKLGNDKWICPEENIILKSETEGNNPLWPTGETTSQITVNKTGKYWLRMDGEFCSGYDTIEIFHKPTPTVNLADTLYLCGDNDNIWIDIYKPGQKYLWSNGAETSKINITSPGKYFVIITENNCVSIDSVEVISIIPPALEIKDSVLCGPFGFTIDAGNWKSYYWQPGNSTSRELFVHEYGRYILRIINEEGCEASDTIIIIESCAPKVWVPNAFTPANNDDINNTFKPVVSDIYNLEMKIYNRWGELIFVSTDANKGWDGTFNGKLCPMDIYIWTISYTSKHTQEYIHGTVNLLR